MSENGEIYTAGKNFTLPPAVTAWTNSTSDISVVASESDVLWTVNCRFSANLPLLNT